MIHGEPKWWKVLLKEPGYWLIGLMLLGILGTVVVESITDSARGDRNQEQKVEQINE